MTFSDELTIIRRFLRDPDGNIWADADILAYWNDTQLEIASKAGYIEKVNTYKYPPEWSWSYMRDWEYQYTGGDRYRCLLGWQAEDMTVCYPWEAGYFLTNSDTPDSGYRFTHPWEGHAAGSPADIIPSSLHARFHAMKFLAYDENELSHISRKELGEMDGFYRTATGLAVNYWNPDEEGNAVVLYPRPSSVTWDDGGLPSSPVDTFSDTGGINTWEEAALPDGEKGVITLTLDTENNLFAIFEALPQDVASDAGSWQTEEIDWPDFLVKYICYGTLERCFGADTDGFIPSLRDFWRLRKELGIKAIKRFKAMRKQDRDYQLGGGRSTAKSRHPRLPAEYPAQWP